MTENEGVKINVTSLENIDFFMIVISSILVALGISLGSFIPGTIVLSIIGAFFAMVGIVVYMILQFRED
jgi:hypothetical protein